MEIDFFFEQVFIHQKPEVLSVSHKSLLPHIGFDDPDTDGKFHTFAKCEKPINGICIIPCLYKMLLT